MLEKNLHEIIFPQVNETNKSIKVRSEVRSSYLLAKINDFDFYLIRSHIWGLLHIYSSVHSYIEKICDNYICACRKILETYQNELPNSHKMYLREMQKISRKIKNAWNKQKMNSLLVAWRNYHNHHTTLNTIMIDWDCDKDKEFILSFGKSPWLNEPYVSINQVFSLSITLIEDSKTFANQFCDMALNPKKTFGIKKNKKLNLNIPNGYKTSSKTKKLL